MGWFTPARQKIVRLKPGDMGRPLGDLAHDFVDTDLVRIASHVRKQRVRVDDEAACYDGRILVRHITPYQSDDDHIGGVVITFIEITEQKQAELTLEQQLADMHAVVVLGSA